MKKYYAALDKEIFRALEPIKITARLKPNVLWKKTTHSLGNRAGALRSHQVQRRL